MDKLQAFVVWLDGYLDATEGNINISKTNLIKNKLYRLFEHEAETLTDKPKKTLEELGQQHGFPVHTNQQGFIGRVDDEGNVYRC
jgi:hypothetical protein